jgi:predicted NAD-dependent protein-ADP-ribosyltransferase YbiA (DUF1768 family)
MRFENGFRNTSTMTNTIATLAFDGFEDENYFMSLINTTNITYYGSVYTSAIQFLASEKASYVCDYKKVEMIMLKMLSVNEMVHYFASTDGIPIENVPGWKILSKYMMFRIMTSRFEQDTESTNRLRETGRSKLICTHSSLYSQNHDEQAASTNGDMIQHHCDSLSEVMMAIRELFVHEFAQSYTHM